MAALMGFPRLLHFLNAQIITVFDCFLKSTEQYGIPSRIRTDQGGENVNDPGILYHW